SQRQEEQSSCSEHCHHLSALTRDFCTRDANRRTRESQREFARSRARRQTGHRSGRAGRLTSRRAETLRSFNDVHDEPAIRIDLMRSFRFLCAATLLVLAARPLAAPARLTSAAVSKITIDGLVDEWPQLDPLEDTHVSAAAQNDG